MGRLLKDGLIAEVDHTALMGSECAWCGRTKRDTIGKKLYRFNNLAKRFCCVSCCRSYHDLPQQSKNGRR